MIIIDIYRLAYERSQLVLSLMIHSINLWTLLFGAGKLYSFEIDCLAIGENPFIIS